MTLGLNVIFISVYYIIVLAVFLQILLEYRNPLKTQSYLLVLLLLPGIGLIIYFFFGVNYRKNKLYSRKVLFDQKQVQRQFEQYMHILQSSRTHLKEELNSRWKLPFLFWRNAYSPISQGNKIKILKNGEEKFPVLFKQLQRARFHIHIEYYIFERGEVFTTLCDILIERAKAGVEVRLIFDAIGTDRKTRLDLEQLTEHGIQVNEYNSVRFYRLANRVNYRDHRKIVIIDGYIGFVGGINIADRYVNKPKSPKYWRDTHCMIEGHACHTLQLMFILNWYFLSHELLPLESSYFPDHMSDDGAISMIIGSEPDSDSANMMEAYFQMITSAEREVLIATPYFIPNEPILSAMTITAKSGVRVVLMLPENIDSKFVKAAGFTYLKELLENDVEVYLYTKGMLHTKLMIVDEEAVSIGTTNMDCRSFDHNAEVNAFFFDSEIAQKLKKDYLNDMKHAIALDEVEWKKRPFRIKFVGAIARLFAPLL